VVRRRTEGDLGEELGLCRPRQRPAGQNLILIRDRDGAVTAFHNTCRHRGSELCAEPEKTLGSKLISCPYHQWSYGLDGRLVRTPFVSITPDFRKEDFTLFSVNVKLWNGFIYLCLADDPARHR
jgi:glycine betaine catabolism A